MQPFDKKIRSVVEKFSYPMWAISLDKNMRCTCADNSTNTPKHDCPKCLGTGYKICIHQIRAARQPYRTSMRGKGLEAAELMYISSYYTLDDVQLHPDDIIVDGNHADIIQDPQENRSDHSTPVYYHYIGAAKQSNLTEFLTMFRKIVLRAGGDV